MDHPAAPHPVGYANGIYGLIGHPYGWAFGIPDPGDSGAVNIGLFWGDGVTGGDGLYATVNYDGGLIVTSTTDAFVATPREHYHVALVWDVDGINGTDDTVRVYRDGTVVSTATGIWDTNGGHLDPNDIWLGYNVGSGENGHTQWITDNMKIWSNAITDFSNRFDEDWTAAAQEEFVFKKSAPVGSEGGKVTALDQDGDPLVYAINPVNNNDFDGDGVPAIAIDALTGTLRVNDSDEFDGFPTDIFYLEVTATDPYGLLDSLEIIVEVDQFLLA